MAHDDDAKVAAAAKRMRAMADSTHVAALNLAMTYGVFHGINEAPSITTVNGRVAEAINSIQHDLLHLMAVRVCALCEKGTRPDDASLPALERQFTPSLRDHLVLADQQWRASIGLRATKVSDVARAIATLRRQCTALRKHDDALKRVKHFRDKLLAHVTTGHDPSNKVLIRDLWQLSRIALSAARSLRLAAHRIDDSYVDRSRRAQAAGKSLAKSIVNN